MEDSGKSLLRVSGWKISEIYNQWSFRIPIIYRLDNDILNSNDPSRRIWVKKRYINSLILASLNFRSGGLYVIFCIKKFQVIKI
jgi:hypothetical protein